MSLSAPLALCALLTLPLLWWLHRRIATAPHVVLPSLLFFVEDAGALVRADRRRRDLDLLLTLLCGLLLALAAAGPLLTGPAPGRRVRAVVAGGAASAQAGLAARTQTALQGLRAALAPADRLEVLALPARGPGPLSGVPLAEGPRPDPAALAALARAGEPDLALVLSDALPDELPGGVRWVALGDPAAGNLGIVAAHLEARPEGARVLATLVNAAVRPVRATLLVLEGESGTGRELLRAAVRLGPEEAGAQLLALPALPEALTLRLVQEEGSVDALAADDAVVLVRRALSWGADLPGESAVLEPAVQRALEAALGAAGLARVEAGPADLWVTAAAPAPRRSLSAGRLVLRLVLGAGAEAQPVAASAQRTSAHPLSADLDLTGLRPGLSAPLAQGPSDGLPDGPPEPRTLLALVQAGVERPVLVLAGPELTLYADPRAGTPPLTGTPFWPLLFDNLARHLLGAEHGGVRVRGLLDPASTQVGRRARALDLGVLAGVAARGAAPERSLRPYAASLAAVLLFWLWSRSRVRGAVPAPARG